MTSACALRLCFSLRASSFCFSITARRASHSPASASASASLSLSRTSLCSNHAFNITMLYLMVPPVMHESMQLHEYQTQMDLLASFMEGKEELHGRRQLFRRPWRSLACSSCSISGLRSWRCACFFGDACGSSSAAHWRLRP